MNKYFPIALFTFFVSFFRLSIYHSAASLVFIPALFGLLIISAQIVQQKSPSISSIGQKSLLYMLYIFLICLVFDFFQSNPTLKSLMSFRVASILVLSILPAYFLVYLIKSNKHTLNRIIIISIWIQLVVFFLMYFNTEFKIQLYSLFALNKANLLEHNLTTRGFGLSTEINYMTPFLMVILCFFMLKKKYLLLLLTCITQIINSNMAFIAIILSLTFSKIKISTKIAAACIFGLIISSIGYSLFPRFYDEFVSGGGFRTLGFLLEDHVFTIGHLDTFSLLFGFQENISSSIPNLRIHSDMGWTILFNYGGIFFITLFIVLIAILSIAAFGKTKLAIIWFLIGMIFNTKGLALGPNSYMFITFVYIFINQIHSKAKAN